MNAVGIDVSKSKSTVTIRQPGDIVVLPPCNIQHTQSEITELINFIKELDGETKVCMEHTGRYYEPMASWLSKAGIFVSAVNPMLIKNYGDESLRAPKTDKADSGKIARYALDRWNKLPVTFLTALESRKSKPSIRLSRKDTFRFLPFQLSCAKLLIASALRRQRPNFEAFIIFIYNIPFKVKPK